MPVCEAEEAAAALLVGTEQHSSTAAQHKPLHMSQLPKALSRLRQAEASMRGSFGDCGILPGRGILNIGSDAQIEQELLPLLESAGLMAADSLYRTSEVVYMVALARHFQMCRLEGTRALDAANLLLFVQHVRDQKVFSSMSSSACLTQSFEWLSQSDSECYTCKMRRQQGSHWRCGHLR